jgi:redox-sensitive bicupin YhaK (pirin superfamily)
MIAIRKATARGVSNLGWLDSRHTFSFADYYDPEHMGFRQLRVINEDRVQPGRGFPPHSHRDMEIITYVVEGALEHKDSLGNGSIIRPGEVQRMSAGRGITHSEFNPSRADPVHFFQIWILPEELGLSPSYEQKTIDVSGARGQFHLIASRQSAQAAVRVHQDAQLSVAILGDGQTLLHQLGSGRGGWLQMVRGEVALNGFRLSASDGAAIDGEAELKIEAKQSSEILFFELG